MSVWFCFLFKSTEFLILFFHNYFVLSCNLSHGSYFISERLLRRIRTSTAWPWLDLVLKYLRGKYLFLKKGILSVLWRLIHFTQSSMRDHLYKPPKKCLACFSSKIFSLTTPKSAVSHQTLIRCSLMALNNTLNQSLTKVLRNHYLGSWFFYLFKMLMFEGVHG